MSARKPTIAACGPDDWVAVGTRHDQVCRDYARRHALETVLEGGNDAIEGIVMRIEVRRIAGFDGDNAVILGALLASHDVMFGECDGDDVELAWLGAPPAGTRRARRAG